MTEIGNYSGNLKKKTAYFGIWQSCFCEVRDSSFIIYKNKESKNPERTIPLLPTTVAEPLPNDSKRFRVDNPGEPSNLFLAESEEATMEWILSIKSQSIKDKTTTMDDFQIISVLGRGFYGKVMLVQRKGTKNLYAIKTIHKARLVQSKKVHTVFSERNVLMKVKHPFIVSLSFAFQTASKFYLGLEYIPGGELFSHIQKKTKLDLDETRFYAAEIGLALSYIHENGIIYRDLKPENILLDEEGHVKITDFGLAKDISFDPSTTTFCGTVEYLAPEIIKRERYSYAIDWWGYGCLIYEMLFGQTPFYDENRARIFQRIPEEDPYFPNDFDENAKDFIMKLLIKDQKQRYTFDSLKNHPFWNGLNFDDVLEKKIKPFYVPIVEDKTIPDNFDPQYTMETPIDSLATPATSMNTSFGGFSYAGSLDSEIKNAFSNPPPIPDFK